MAAPDHCGPPGPAVSPVAVLQPLWLRNSTTAPSCELRLRYCCPAVRLCRACSISATRETITTPPRNIYSSWHRFPGARRRGNPPRRSRGPARPGTDASGRDATRDGEGPRRPRCGPDRRTGRAHTAGQMSALACLPGQTVTGVPSIAEACCSEPGMPVGAASGRARQVKPS